MLKRVILAGATLLCAVVGLLIYRQVTGEAEPDFGDEVFQGAAESSADEGGDEAGRIDIGEGRQIGDVKGVVYITRDSQRRPTQEFGFDARIPGGETMVRIRRPWIRIYGKDDRIVEITGVTGSVAIGDLAGEMPQRGSLEGNVRIVVYGGGYRPVTGEPPRAEPTGDEIVELLVKLQRIDFEQEFSRITSGGEVTIRSAQLCVDGRDLMLLYDQVNGRLAELEVRQLDKLLLAEPQESSVAKPTGETTAQSGEPSDSEEADGTGEIYRLSLSDDVIISGRTEQVTGDRIEVLVDLSGMGEDDSDTDSKAVGGGKSEVATAGGLTYRDLEGMPIDPCDMVTVTCTGPLRVTYAGDEPGMTAGQREFIAYGKPAKIWRDGEVVVEADELHWNAVSETMRLLPGPWRPVRITLGPGQWATAGGEVSVMQRTGQVTLMGPGRVEYRGEEEKPASVVTYEDAMRVTFAKSADGAEETMMLAEQVEKIEFAGKVSAVSDAGSFSADHAVALLEPGRNGNPQVREIVATGSVRVADPNYQIEADESLRIVFDNSKPAEEGHGDEGAGKLELDRVLGSGRISSAVAVGSDGGVRITLLKEQYQVIGDRAEGSGNLWTVSGKPARIVSLAAGAELEEFSGNEIRVDRNQGTFSVAGAGNMWLRSENDLVGGKLGEPRPVHVVWERGLTYQSESDKIVLGGVRVEMSGAGENTFVRSTLSGAKMTLYLADGDDDRQKKGDLLGGRGFDHMVVAGPGVEVLHSEYAGANGELLRRTRMQARELMFDNTSERVTALGEGWVEVSDYRAADAEQGKAKDVSVGNALSGMFDRGGASYMLVQFGGDMQFRRADGIRFGGGVRVVRLPLGEDGKPSKGDFDGIVRIDCEEFDIKLDSQNKPSELRARGGVFLETIMDGRQHFMMGERLTFDIRRSEFTMQAGEGIAVLLDQMQFRRVRYNLNSGALDAEPLGLSEVAVGQ